jgi:GH24 family phage-related lysozyme (muramidase)
MDLVDIPTRAMSTTKSIKEIRKELQVRLGFTGDDVDGNIGKASCGRINERLDELDRFKGVLVVAEPLPPKAVLVEEGVGADTFPGLATNWTPPPERGSMTISRVGFDQIVYFEIGGASYYTKRLQAPTWPGWSSGVTIGIGYDLGYNTDEQIRKDWTGVIPDWMVDKLVGVNQYRGEGAKGPAATLKAAGVRITLEQAQQVYAKSTLPRFARMTKAAYPGIEKLPPDAQAAILSLVFNRGAGMDNTDKRSEMRALRPAVASRDLVTMSNLLLRMQRHWSKTSGLFTRRAKEAQMVRESDRLYRKDELIVV